MNVKLNIAVLLMIYLLSSKYISGQDAGSEFVESSARQPWGVTLTPYAWLAGQSTDVGGEQLRQSFNDLSSLTNFGFQLSTSLRYQRFILSIDGTYAELGSETGSENLIVDVSIDQWIIDSKLGILVYDDITYHEDDVIAGWSLEVNTGAKYWSNIVKLNYTLFWKDKPLLEDNIRDVQDWWDLMIGLRTRLILSRSVLLSVALNYGGFGIGNSSSSSWDLTYVNTFKINDLILVSAGYRTFHYKRIDGEGEAELETKVSAFGPMLGVTLAF